MKTITQFESKYSKEIHSFLKNALNEDLGNEDHTSKSYIKNKTNNSFKLITKSNCVISGIRLSEILIEKFRSNLSLEIFFLDGDKAKKGEKMSDDLIDEAHETDETNYEDGELDVKFEIKTEEIGEEKGLFSGYGSIFNNIAVAINVK